MSQRARWVALTVGALVATIPFGLWVASVWVGDGSSTAERLTLTGCLLTLYATVVGGAALILIGEGNS